MVTAHCLSVLLSIVSPIEIIHKTMTRALPLIIMDKSHRKSQFSMTGPPDLETGFLHIWFYSPSCISRRNSAWFGWLARLFRRIEPSTNYSSVWRVSLNFNVDSFIFEFYSPFCISRRNFVWFSWWASLQLTITHRPITARYSRS